jgi:hypothetical protein
MAGEGVWNELVSAVISLVHRKNTGNFAEKMPVEACSPIVRVPAAYLRQRPCLLWMRVVSDSRTYPVGTGLPETSVLLAGFRHRIRIRSGTLRSGRRLAAWHRMRVTQEREAGRLSESHFPGLPEYRLVVLGEARRWS